MNLAEMLKKENIFIADSYTDTASFYADYAVFLQQKGIIEDKESVTQLFVKRENIQSTAIGNGVAAPHIFAPDFSEFLFSLALIKEGIDFKAPDGGKVFLIFLIMSNKREEGRHLKTLAHIARLVRSTQLVEQMKTHLGPDEIHALIRENEKLI